MLKTPIYMNKPGTACQFILFILVAVSCKRTQIGKAFHRNVAWFYEAVFPKQNDSPDARPLRKDGVRLTTGFYAATRNIYPIVISNRPGSQAIHCVPGHFFNGAVCAHL